jgi:hypothetical protein
VEDLHNPRTEETSMARGCERLTPLNERSERVHDNAPRDDGGSGYTREARRARVPGATDMMSESRATELEGWMKNAVPVSFYGDD